MGKPKAPPPPDYAGAAKEQGAANKEAAIASSKLSNPNIINPYGQQTVTYGGEENLIPTVTQTLSPEQKALFDQSNRISQGMGDLAEGGIDRVGSMLGTGFNMDNIPGQAQAGQQGWDNAYNAIVERNQPFMDRRREMTETQLSNQGIFRGSEAHGNAQRDLANQENDFLLGAQQQATGQQQAQFGMDTQARQNAISQEAFLRQLPLNEINALRSGAIINVPQFQGFQGQQMAASPIMQATQAQDQANMGRYNIESAGFNNMMSGLFGLGGAAMMAPKGTFSDIRLKENIKRIGTTPGGIPFYSYNYIWDQKPQAGVMAQEVEHIPGAVIEHESGYKLVDYSKVH